MKKQITGFILGALCGGVVIFTIAADSHHPTAWDYNVVDQEIPLYLYQKTLTNTATNGWELVSSQIVPNVPGAASSLDKAELYMVFKRAKQ